MTTIDLSPLYRSSVGFDRFGSMLDSALRSDKTATGYPPYDIEAYGSQPALNTALQKKMKRQSGLMW